MKEHSENFEKTERNVFFLFSDEKDEDEISENIYIKKKSKYKKKDEAHRHALARG